jgi:sucrose phosphorylase
LKQWLEISPRNAVTVLDTHDGIGLIDIGPDDDRDRPGLVPADELAALVEKIHTNSKGQSRLATGAAASNLDIYQVNCTYYDALGRKDSDYLMARAIQFFIPGIPQVYYAGLLAGENDLSLLAKTGIGRDINRHYYTMDEIEAAIQRPVVQALFELIRFRNQHSAFQGTFSLPPCPDSSIRLRWDNGAAWAVLDVDFVSGSYGISNSPL